AVEPGAGMDVALVERAVLHDPLENVVVEAAVGVEPAVGGVLDRRIAAQDQQRDGKDADPQAQPQASRAAIGAGFGHRRLMARTSGGGQLLSGNVREGRVGCYANVTM